MTADPAAERGLTLTASAMADALVDQRANPAFLALIADSELLAPTLLDSYLLGPSTRRC